MQITSITSFAALALTLGAAAAQSAPRVLQIDETPATPSTRAAEKPSEVRVLRTADGGEVVLSPSTTVLGSGGGSGPRGLQEPAQQGFLGVQLGDGDGGAEVNGLVDGSPAQQAKVQAGDRIVALDGEPIATSQELTAAIRGKRPGTVVKLSIARGDEELVQEVTLGTRGGSAAPTAPLEARRPRTGAPQQIELRTLDVDGAQEHGAHAQGTAPHRVEVRKEVHQDGDGEPRVKVWVNGQEIDPHAMGGGSFEGDAFGEFEVEVEGLEGMIEQRFGGGHTFRFEDGEPGKAGRFVVVHPGGNAGEPGQMKVEGHAMPRMMVHGGGSPALQRRVDELEGQVQRLEEHVRSLEQMVRELRGGDRAQPRAGRAPAGQANENRRRDPRAGEAAPGPRPPQGTNAAETPSSGFFFDNGPDEGAGKGRAGGNENDELRREMRDLMRAIERLERQGGGRGGNQGGGQGGNQGGNQPR